jgi:hypothetical protein
MNHRIHSVWALLALAVLAAPGPARADTITPIFFDGFEADKADVLDATLLNWNVVSGSIDVLSAGNLCGPSGDYSKCVDLDGTGAMAGTIATKATFNLAPGLYQLSFDLAGANRKWRGSEVNTVNVSLGSFFSEDLTMLQWDPFTTITREILIENGGAAKIQFAHQGSDWIGLLLDNVSLARVEREVVPTPEGGAWELTIALLGVAAVWIFRKKAGVLGARG